jgi:hypothetical protein
MKKILNAFLFWFGAVILVVGFAKNIPVFIRDFLHPELAEHGTLNDPDHYRPVMFIFLTLVVLISVKVWFDQRKKK